MQIFRKTIIFNHLIRTRTYAYQEVRNVSFSEILRTCLMDDPFWVKKVWVQTDVKVFYYFQHVAILCQYLWYLVDGNPSFGKKILRLYNAFNIWKVLFEFESLFELFHHSTYLFV